MKKQKPVLLIIFLIFYQCFIYFIAKFTPFEMNLLASKIDGAIPFVPWFIFFYVLWYLMLFLVPFTFYKYDSEKFYEYFLSCMISITICGIIYFVFPTFIVRDSININGISTFLVDLIYKMDTPALNCLPSMHCLICFLFIIYCNLSAKIPNRYKYVINALSVLVVLSTLFVKQHILIDVISSLIISILISVVVNKKLKNVFVK